MTNLKNLRMTREIKLTSVVNHHNADTFIKNFIDYIPKRLDYVYEVHADSMYIDYANCLDFFDFHYRKFLIGTHKNLSRVFFEIRRSLDSGLPKELLIEVTEEVREIVLDGEFYELMPRLEVSLFKIKKLINAYKPEGAFKCPF